MTLTPGKPFVTHAALKRFGRLSLRVVVGDGVGIAVGHLEVAGEGNIPFRRVTLAKRKLSFFCLDCCCSVVFK